MTGNWVIVGSVYVGGNLQIDNGAGLIILYDDEINSFTQVTSVRLNVDSVTSSPLQHL